MPVNTIYANKHPLKILRTKFLGIGAVRIKRTPISTYDHARETRTSTKFIEFAGEYSLSFLLIINSDIDINASVRQE